MSSFIDQAVQLQPEGDQVGWLDGVRLKGRAAWQVRQFPTRKTEDWKYTSLYSLEQGDYLHWSKPVADDVVKDCANIENLDALRLVFVNGYYSEGLSSIEAVDGLECVRFHEASEQQREVISSKLGSVADKQAHMFADLNDSWLSDGVYLCAAKNTAINKPVHIVYLSAPQQQAFSVQQRLLIELETGAELQVIEHFASTDEQQNGFTNGLTEIEVGENATLTHYRLNLEEEHVLHIGGVHVNLRSNSTLKSFFAALGSEVCRSDIVVNHLGKGSECFLNGIYLPSKEQHVDFHTCIEHKQPHGMTREVFRGIMADKAKAVFNGRIHIHKDAQKVSAELENNNLLTSLDAEVNTKPELEIYADDVQCAHGATVAQLEEKALYYMQTRGIDRVEAEMLLSFGFINELIEQLGCEPLVVYLRQLLVDLFAEEESRIRDVL